LTVKTEVTELTSDS